MRPYIDPTAIQSPNVVGDIANASMKPMSSKLLLGTGSRKDIMDNEVRSRPGIAQLATIA